ncbi:hypothetical protein SDD30_08240 [Moorella naiadis]|uniref:hypothetical protein n=1 Tax=Moorella naiadis (nom. illeg.) TaxID=3093670 RepID=UPI003D9C8F4E
MQQNFHPLAALPAALILTKKAGVKQEKVAWRKLNKNLPPVLPGREIDLKSLPNRSQ